MSRRRSSKWSLRKNSLRKVFKGNGRMSEGRNLEWRQLGVEKLEERYLLTATLLEVSLLESAVGVGNVINTAPMEIGTSAPPPNHTDGTSAAILGSGAGGETPFPLEQTFSLHSLAGATKRIYLDFTGF